MQRPDTSNNYDMRPTSSYRVGPSSFASASTPRAPVPRPVVSSSGAEVFSLESPAPAPSPPVAAPPSHRRGEPKENVVPPEQQPEMPPPAEDWWKQTTALLGQLHPEAPVEALIKTCDRLWERLRQPAGPAGPAGADSLSESELARRHREITFFVARLMDRKEPQLLLRLCRFFLKGGTTERSAQLGACKLLFKLSKNESNDARFRDLGLLPLLLAVLHPEHAFPSTSSADSSRPGTSAGVSGVAVAVEPLGGCEALLYAAGALKLTSKDTANQKALLALGAVSAIAAALRAQTARLMSPQADSTAPSTPRSEGRGVKPAHVLVQLTETLRNVAISGSSRKQFVSSGCVEELCTLFRVAPTNTELCLNVSRVLAKLSLHEDVRMRIDAHPEHIDGMAKALTVHHGEPQLLIRLCFILGNLSAANDRNRDAIAKVCLPLLLTLLDQYASGGATPAAAAPTGVSTGVSMGVQTGGEGRAVTGAEDAEATGDGPTDAASSSVDATAGGGAGGGAADPRGATRESEAERSVGESSAGGGAAGGASAATDIVDVLVKLIRLVAHLGISPHIGEQIVTRPQALALLKVLHSYSMEQHEELQLNAISAVTNLSYYLVEGSVLLSSHEALCRALIPVLVFPNTEGMVEASRALGNLSRLQDARATICQVRAHEALLMLLDHSSSMVAEGACGALINLAADADTREQLLQAGAAPKLADLLLTLLSPAAPSEGAGGHAGAPAQVPSTLRSDIGAALLAAKTLCNLCCMCTVSPLPADLAVALEERLAHGAVPPAWKSAAAETMAMLGEWPQATSLLLQLLSRLPAADLPSYGAEDGEYECEEPDLEELPMLG